MKRDDEGHIYFIFGLLAILLLITYMLYEKHTLMMRACENTGTNHGKCWELLK